MVEFVSQQPPFPVDFFLTFSVAFFRVSILTPTPIVSINLTFFVYLNDGTHLSVDRELPRGSPGIVWRKRFRGLSKIGALVEGLVEHDFLFYYLNLRCRHI